MESNEAAIVERVLEEKNTLFEMFTECQITAEAAAGLNQDDDDPPSHMRLVRD